MPKTSLFSRSIPQALRCIHLLLISSTFAWLTPRYSEASERLRSSFQQQEAAGDFEEQLRRSELAQAQELLQCAREQQAPWVGYGALQLGYEFYKLGCREPALEILEQYRPLLEQPHLKPYSYILKARLIEQEELEGAWRALRQALALLAPSQWPSEDRSFLEQIKERLSHHFHLQQEAAERLAASGMYDEAIAIYQRLAATITSEAAPDYPPDSAQGLDQLRQIALELASIQLEAGRSGQTLELLLPWDELSATHLAPSPMQQVRQQLLIGQAYLAQGNSDASLPPLQTAFERAQRDGKMPWLCLQSALSLCQALAQQQRLLPALELIEQVEPLVKACDKRSLAHAAWWEQRCHLLCQAGRLHQALEELSQQLRAQGAGRSRLLLLQAKLNLQIGELAGATASYLDLLEADPSPQQSSWATQFLLERWKQTPQQITFRLCQLLLRPNKPLLEPRAMLELCRWAIDQSIASQEELRRALTPWLERIEPSDLQPYARYLIAYLMPEGAARRTAFEKLAELKQEQDSIGLLAQGQLALTQSDGYAQLQQLAERASGQVAIALRSWAAQKAASSQDPRLWRQAFEQAKAADLEGCDGWKWAQIELGFQLSQVEELPRGSATAAAQLARKPTYWGMQAAISHARALMKRAQAERAVELMDRWCAQQGLCPFLQQLASIEMVDLLHRAGKSEAARIWIARIVELWPSLELRPWIELRRYSLQEYRQAASGTTENLHQLLVRYREHPVALAIYYLKALQGESSTVQEQLRLWEDLERKAQELTRLDRLDEQASLMATQGRLNRARCLKRLRMPQQAIGCLHSALAQLGLCHHLLGAALEQQARYELSQLYQEQGNLEQADEQLQKIVQSPYSSEWSARAQLELAARELESQHPEKGLQLLSQLVAEQPALIARRLQLASEAYAQLKQFERSRSLLAQLLAMERSGPEVEEIQLRALWQRYDLLSRVEPQQARALLLQLTRSNDELGAKARTLLGIDRVGIDREYR